jgi:hypothetical protein
LEVEKKVVERELEAMQKKGVKSFWPKPILHPSLEDNYDMVRYI